MRKSESKDTLATEGDCPMPELPEVETIRRQLQENMPFTIEEVVYSPVVHSILKEKAREFDPRGHTLSRVERKGKLLDFHLPDGKHILGHLGMSGSWRISPKPINEKHTHLQFKGRSRGKKRLYLAYIDPRRFGSLHFLSHEAAQTHLQRLGLDVSGPKFTVDALMNLVKRFPQRQIKPFLLEQKHLCGVGNYMACEICALAGIRPTRRLQRITRREAGRLHHATGQVIHRQIAYQGLSFSGGYKDAFGDDGGGLSQLVVFHQEICGMCQVSAVKKIVMHQRGTYYCPRCQH